MNNLSPSRPNLSLFFFKPQLLNYLGALDDEGEMTPLGYKMAEMPLDPQLAKLLITSPDYGCSNEIVSIVAMMSVPQIHMRPKEAAKAADECKAQFDNVEGDHLTLLNTYTAYMQNNGDKNWCWENFINERSMSQACSVRNQLIGVMQKLELPLVGNDVNSVGYYTNIRQCLTTGMFMSVAYLQVSERALMKTRVMNPAKWLQTLRLHPLLN